MKDKNTIRTKSLEDITLSNERENSYEIYFNNFKKNIEQIQPGKGSFMELYKPYSNLKMHYNVDKIKTELLEGELGRYLVKTIKRIYPKINKKGVKGVLTLLQKKYHEIRTIYNKSGMSPNIIVKPKKETKVQFKQTKSSDMIFKGTPIKETAYDNQETVVKESFGTYNGEAKKINAKPVKVEKNSEKIKQYFHNYLSSVEQSRFYKQIVEYLASERDFLKNTRDVANAFKKQEKTKSKLLYRRVTSNFQYLNKTYGKIADTLLNEVSNHNIPPDVYIKTPLNEIANSLEKPDFLSKDPKTIGELTISNQTSGELNGLVSRMKNSNSYSDVYGFANKILSIMESKKLYERIIQ